METYQLEKLNEYRTRKVLSLFSFIVVNGYELDLIETGKWFSYVTIKEEKVRERYLQFDDGWTYQHYWSEWIENWKFVEIINK